MKFHTPSHTDTTQGADNRPEAITVLGHEHQILPVHFGYEPAGRITSCSFPQRFYFVFLLREGLFLQLGLW